MISAILARCNAAAWVEKLRGFGSRAAYPLLCTVSGKGRGGGGGNVAIA